MKVFKNGLLTGLILQLAIGPVFFFIINLAMQKTIYDGLAGVLAVTIVDYFYITLALIGASKILERKQIKNIFNIVSPGVLIVLGLMIIKSASSIDISTEIVFNHSDLFSSFGSTFLLTISSPMGIIFWTSIFATKAAEYHYTKRELFVFGFSTGLATLLFMGAAAILFASIRGIIPVTLVKTLNILVGGVLIYYGGSRLIKHFI